MSDDPSKTPVVLLCLLHGHWWQPVTYGSLVSNYIYWCHDCDTPTRNIADLLDDEAELDRMRMLDLW